MKYRIKHVRIESDTLVTDKYYPQYRFLFFWIPIKCSVYNGLDFTSQNYTNNFSHALDTIRIKMPWKLENKPFISIKKILVND